ncbi:hypothetical protein D3C71_1591790 [compost metagenome]
MAECEAAIIPAASHAQPPALCVETDQRRHHQRHLLRCERVVQRQIGFGDAEAVGGQCLPRAPRCEAQRFLVQDRQAVGQAGGQLHLPAVQRDFPIHRPVAGDMALRGRERKGEQAIGQVFGGGQAHGGGEITAALAQLLTQCGARVGHAWVRSVRGKRIKQERRPMGTPLLLEYCILRRDDACETTLNPGFKWVRWGSIGLPATRRTCTPGAVAHPWS